MIRAFVTGFSILCYISLYAQPSNRITPADLQISNGDELVQLDPALKMGKLKNGLTYYIRKNSEPQNRIVLYLVNKVGSVLEDETQLGLAHFLEHMCFNGTKNFPKQELVKYLEKSGVRFGADLNAYTSYDETVYQLPIAGNNPELLNQALQILRDWAGDVLLEDSEIDKERGVVLEELRMRSGVQQRIMNKSIPYLVNHSLYADRLPIGKKEILASFNYETLRSFYKDWYRPDLQAVIVVGDINVKDLEKLISEKFSDLKMPANPRPRIPVEIPLNNKSQFTIITDPEVANTRFEIHLKRKSGSFKTRHDFLGRLFQSLFNDLVNARFAEVFQQKDHPVSSAFVRYEHLMSNLDDVLIGFQPKAQKELPALKSVLEEIERIRRFGFTELELTRAKENLLNGIEKAFKERSKTYSDNYVKEYVRHFLTEEMSPGIEFEYNFIRKHIPLISTDQFKEYLNNLLADYWKTETNRDLIVVANDKDLNKLPAESACYELFEQVPKFQLEAYTDPVEVNVLMTEKPIPGTTLSRKELEKVGVTELVLSNGVRVLLKPTNFKRDEILISAISKGGTSWAEDKDLVACNLATPAVLSGGIGNFTANGLRRFMAGKSVTIQPFIEPLYEGFKGQSSVKEFETALQLIHQYFYNVRKDQVSFDRMVEGVILSLNNSSHIPEAIFQDSVMTISRNYHPRLRKPTPEELKGLSIDDAFRCFQERFADASDFTFLFVGSFDIEKIKPLLEMYLGSLPALKRNEGFRDLGIDLNTGYLSRKIFKGVEDKALVSLNFSGNLKYESMELIYLNRLCDVLRLRLTEKLREEAGGVYSVNVFEQPVKYPRPGFSILINFSCKPENVEMLILSVMNEFEKLKREGPAAEELQIVNAQVKPALEQAFRTNEFWIGNLTRRVQNDMPVEELADLKRSLQKLKAEDVQQAANQFLSGENFMRFVMMPESKNQ